MPISYTIERDNNVILEKWTGDVRAAELESYWTQYLANPEVLAIRRTIVDLRETRILFTGDQLDALIQSLVLPLLKVWDWTTAFVVEKPTEYGVTRQYQVFADRYSKDAIFHHLDDARLWLRSLDSKNGRRVNPNAEGNRG